MASALIIGAGMAGLACGQALADVGHRVVLIDKGRGAGGRMAARRMASPLGDVTFDHGAQYFTTQDPDFLARVRQWADAGVVGLWQAAGDGAWVGTPSMNAPLKALARDRDVRWGTRATALSRTPTGWAVATEDGTVITADALVTALPAEQTADLLAPVAGPFADMARATPSAPCWTLMLAFSERLASAGDCVRGTDADALGWAARNSSKPGRGEIETWVIQAGADWSAGNLEALPETVETRMMEALSRRLGVDLPDPVVRVSHRWRYARSGEAAKSELWDRGISLGVCGDWLLGPRVEDAWRSGTLLARRMAADLD
jgi:predicted NAD/FAD-dependent oxidoreductase